MSTFTIQNPDCLQEYDKLDSSVVAAMCIEYRAIHNSIGRVLEMPDTRITDYAKRVTLDRTQFIIYQQACIIFAPDIFGLRAPPDCALMP